MLHMFHEFHMCHFIQQKALQAIIHTYIHARTHTYKHTDSTVIQNNKKSLFLQYIKLDL